jgi:tetratricopeptide (TPR) repeat protein
LLLAIVALALISRWANPTPPPPPSSPTSAGLPAAPPNRPVIFLGLDGADWQLLDRYVAAGMMPNLATLERQGQTGILETQHPPLSPLVWTTMMTGATPVEHGILDFTRFNPQSGAVEPITSDERRRPAIWNLASSAGRRVAVFALWATYPAEAVQGLIVSDRLFAFLYPEQTPPPGIVFPADRESWARDELRRAQEAVGFAQLKQYLPWLTAAEYHRHAKSTDPYAHPVSALRRILIETRVYHQLATQAIARQQLDLAVVYFQGTDTIGHVFAPFAPPRAAEVSARDYARYHQVPELYFRYLDSLLGEYRQLAQQRDAVVMIASDHGFLWFEGRPTQLASSATTTAARWHRDDGIYLLWGPGILATPQRQRGGVQQVAATLLALLGLPPAKGVRQPPLPGVRESALPAVDYAARFGAAATPAAAGNARGAEELAKLRALGYLGAGDVGKAPPGRHGNSTRTAGSYNNEGLWLHSQRLDADAQSAFEQALALDPDHAAANWNLSDLLFGKREFERSDILLLRALVHGLPEGTKYVIGRAIGYQRAGDPERSLRLMSGAVAADPREPELWLFRGRYRVEQKDCAGALLDFDKAVQLAPRDASAYSSSGVARLCVGDRAGAERDFRKSLEINPDQPKLRQLLHGD